jgi:hypothetical protein
VKKTVLEELSGDLSDKEREDLLIKIKQSITSTRVTEVDGVSEAHTEGERNKLLLEELKHLSFFQKIIIWIISRLSGKKREEVFAARQVQALKHIINKKAPGITGFETRNLTPVLAQTLFDIYQTILPIRRYFQDLWLKEGCFERVVIFLMNQRIEEPQETLDQFISMEELVSLYADTGSREALKEELLRRLSLYIEAIPAQDVMEAESQLSPFYFLKDMVLFPYASFFQLFRFNPVAMPEITKPYFKNASAMLALGYLEKLYVATQTASRIQEPLKIDTSLIEYLFMISEEARSDEEQNEKEEREPELMKDERLKQHVHWIQDIYRKSIRMQRNLPLLEMLRYFQKDPYFIIQADIPELHFKEFYYLLLKRLLLARLDERYPEIQQRFIQEEIDTLFKGKKIFALQNYRDYSTIDYEKLGLPFFVHTKSVNLLYNYVHHFYREYFYDMVQLLDRNILAQNRLTRDRLERYSGSFEETEQRVKEFDYSLSPESEDGKLFQRLRFSLASDPTLQKMYRSIVIQKDREVKLLLERAEEDINGFLKLLDEMITSPAEMMKIQLGTHYLIQGRPVLLKTLLITRRDHLRKFWNLMSQIIKLEKH